MNDRNRPAGTARPSWPDALLLLAVFGLAAANLGQPFIWDGAFFTLCARKLAAGATLYRDVWDVKQPGLFWFFLAAGRTFGFDEWGARALDAVWMGTLALGIRVALGRAFSRPVFASLAALLSVGYAYAFASGTQLGQVEWLVGLPLFAVLAAALRSRASARAWAAWALLAGLAGGVALVFKFALLPLVGVLGLVALWPERAAAPGAARTWPVRRALAALAIAGLGMAIVAAAIAARFAADGTLGLVRWTFFVLPPRILAHMHGVRTRALGEALGWFLPRWAPLLGFAFVGALARGRDRWTAASVAWIGVALAVILVQRFSYWPYHFMLLVVPLGLLAARGVEAIEQAFEPGAGARGARLRAGALVALVCLWAVLAGAGKGIYLAHDRFLRGPDMLRRSHLRFSEGGVYAKVLADVAFLSAPGARPGPVFEVGNPLFLWLARRDQAGPRNPAMLFELMEPSEWAACARDLAASHAAYVFVQRDFPLDRPPVLERSAAFRRELDSRWRVERTTAGGTWYVPRDTAAAGRP